MGTNHPIKPQTPQTEMQNNMIAPVNAEFSFVVILYSIPWIVFTEPKGRDSRKQIVVFKKITTFF